MNKLAKIEVCANCSGFDVGELKGRGNVKIGCIGKCARKCPELQGKAYGFLNGVFTVCDTKEDFLARAEGLDAFVPVDERNPLVDAFLEHTEKWRDEFAKLRLIALGCGLDEELKWGQPCYTLQNGNVAILGGYKEYIALTFFKGALLKDPQGMLIRQTQNVQAGRQLRFTNGTEIAEAEPMIRAYFLEAIAIETAGLKVPVEEKTELPIPDELQAQFDEKPDIQAAFLALTPGRQKGYLFYFNGAKQSKTRASRIEKCVPRILAGKGLDD